MKTARSLIPNKKKELTMAKMNPTVGNSPVLAGRRTVRETKPTKPANVMRKERLWVTKLKIFPP